MKFELTIQEMFDNYPGLFQTRAQCLNHLFLVVGNGYEWKNGQLIDKYTTSKASELRPHLVNNKAHQHIVQDPFFPHKERRHMWYCCRFSEGKEVIKWSEDYCYLFNFPEDIRPDWKAGIEECKQLLREDGYDV